MRYCRHTTRVLYGFTTSLSALSENIRVIRVSSESWQHVFLPGCSQVLDAPHSHCRSVLLCVLSEAVHYSEGFGRSGNATRSCKAPTNICMCPYKVLCYDTPNM